MKLRLHDSLSVDDALFQLMSFSVAFNMAKKQGEKKVASRISSTMRAFCFRNLPVCLKASKKYNSMSDDEKSAFYNSYGKQAEEIKDE